MRRIGLRIRSRFHVILNPASFIDHTLLRPDATSDQVLKLCEEAVELGFAAVCVPPVYVRLAASRLYGSEVRVATVAGFPFGYLPAVVKAFEAAEAVAAGAAEVDMVVHLGAVLSGRMEEVRAEIAEVVRAARGGEVKVILECCYLDNPAKEAVVEQAVSAGAAFVKTSTGYGPGGATLEDVRLLTRAAAGRAGVKAAGGIRDWPTCRAMLEAGANRIGTSAGVEIVRQWRQAEEG